MVFTHIFISTPIAAFGRRARARRIGSVRGAARARRHDKPIGPHSQAMYQVAFLPPQFGTVVPWLMLHRQELNILVHLETGDDLADHTTHSLWLGEKLELNVEVLRPRTANAKFACHHSQRWIALCRANTTC
ncbi:DOPA 4,5-dioxygenase family protein [Microcoleus sp. MOSTC5]|uniref:DOPA 4,5-dioxygenase family protein n=1 Tax=Microcoleus sp. MOSTC5 TaxID=3055378 RepID=UPI002FD6009F